MSRYLPPFHVGPVSVKRTALPFTEDEVHRIVDLTWEVVGHAPIDKVRVRFDREGTYYHARKAGFEGNREDWKVEEECGDPSAYTAELSGLTLTPTCPDCRSHEGISVDVFFFPPFGDETPERVAESKREAVETLSHELAHAADLRVLGEPDALALVSLPRLNPPSRNAEGRDEEAESYAECVAAEVVRRFFEERAEPEHQLGNRLCYRKVR